MEVSSKYVPVESIPHASILIHHLYNQLYHCLTLQENFKYDYTLHFHVVVSSIAIVLTFIRMYYSFYATICMTFYHYNWPYVVLKRVAVTLQTIIMVFMSEINVAAELFAKVSSEISEMYLYLCFV